MLYIYFPPIKLKSEVQQKITATPMVTTLQVVQNKTFHIITIITSQRL